MIEEGARVLVQFGRDDFEAILLSLCVLLHLIVKKLFFFSHITKVSP